jgi:hypothetical protein
MMMVDGKSDPLNREIHASFITSSPHFFLYILQASGAIVSVQLAGARFWVLMHSLVSRVYNLSLGFRYPKRS